MNILLISECDKRALVETRRILDQFAERRGERTWQTPITQAGLDTLHRLLRQTARKNTAVACHWIRGLDHSELLWVVGDRRRFNAEGAVPTQSTTRDVLRRDDENTWRAAPIIRALAELAALLHDLGKATVAFQRRLRGRGEEGRNLIRHEWVSLRLFQAFVGTDTDERWLERLAAPTPADDSAWTHPERWRRDGLTPDLAAPPFSALPPWAAAVGWLVLTHHRLPQWPRHEGDKQKPLGSPVNDDIGDPATWLARVGHDWNERVASPAPDAQALAPWWALAGPLPVTMPTWRAKAAKVARRLQGLQATAMREGQGPWLNEPFVMHLARLALMLADHHHSALPRSAPDRPHADELPGDGQGELYANTGPGGRLRQRLDAHLLGVQRDAARTVHGLTRGLGQLPHLSHPGLRKRSGQGRFQWQDKAADLAAAWRPHAAAHGAFVVNMASTGCGKTLANARLMNALAEPARGLRCTFALGLRSLTLQTGRAYRQALKLKPEHLALRVGGSASRALFEHHERQAQALGSASSQALIEEDGEVLWEGEGGAPAARELLGLALHDARIHRLVAAPLLVCTVDHLTPATEATRGGRQIAPMLRLLSSDLVLDELDDFDLADLPALTRLLHWAGLLGARVLVSSATLPPALVQGAFEAYRAGRLHWHRHRGDAAIATPAIACLWADEHGAQAQACAEGAGFEAAHAAFVARRCQRLQAAPCVRRAALLPLPAKLAAPEALTAAFAARLLQAIAQAHALHAQPDPVTGQPVSFGLVRMANIRPLIAVAQALFALDAPPGLRLHVCVYHARHPLLVRSAIEGVLDEVLDRRDPERCWQLPVVRERLDAQPDEAHAFVVLASPVCEVGRDWDADWAIAEPSSMRALIQLAGRVQRHRNLPGEAPNVWVFERNLRALREPGEAAFIRPGFEQDTADAQHPHRLRHHHLGALLAPELLACLDARPRIACPPEPLRPSERWVDLEHARLRAQMLPSVAAATVSRRGKPQPAALNAAACWQSPQAGLTGVLPQQQPFRDQALKEETLVLLPEETGDGPLRWHRIHEEARGGKQAIYTLEDSRIHPLPLELGRGMRPWAAFDVASILPPLAEALGMGLRQAAERFTVTTVPASAHGWLHHPVLGFLPLS